MENIPPLNLEMEDIGPCCQNIRLHPLIMVPMPIRMDDAKARLLQGNKTTLGFMVVKMFCEGCGAQWDVIKNGPAINLVLRKEVVP